jgi:hypothetical protein
MTGFTNPTYTVTEDRAPDASNGLQYAVTALGGTQTGVTPHSASSPFTVTWVKPKVFKTLGQVNPITGALPNVPKNQWICIIRKGVTPLAGQPAAIATIRITMDIPAGADLADPANLRALFGFFGGAWTQGSNFAGQAESIVSGIL